MNIKINKDLDFNVSYDTYKEEFENLKSYKSSFNKYDMLYNDIDIESKELKEYKDRIQMISDNSFTLFEDVKIKLENFNKLNEEKENIISQCCEITKGIVDEISKLKAKKINIQKREIICERILEEYSLSPLCYNNLTDIKISLNMEFFEHLKQFEYTKESIKKLLNENSSDKLDKFYSKHYNKILNKACKKICLHVIREDNKLYITNTNFIDLLLFPNNEEHENKKNMIKNHMDKFSPLTKLCYKIIAENIEYFNICLNNFVHLKKKLLTKKYNYLISNKDKLYLSTSHEVVDIKYDSLQNFKYFVSVVYYLITLEDIFFRILLLFNFDNKNDIFLYISAHIENMHNNLYNISDTLFVLYKQFIETNINICPKSYQFYYKLFHILDVFIFKLKQFQNSYDGDKEIRKLISKYSIETFKYNININYDENNHMDASNLRRRNSYLYSPSDKTSHHNKMNKSMNENDYYIDPLNQNSTIKPQDIKHENDSDTNKRETAEKGDNNYHLEYDEENDEVTYSFIKKSEVDDNLTTKDVKEKNESNTTYVKKNNSEIINKLNEKKNSLEKYNCKILNYTQKIQKKIENEFIALWQQDVVTFYLNNIKQIESNYFDNSRIYIKKILNSLNDLYSIYKNSVLFNTYNKDQNFQNVLDITINPLINNSLKYKNQSGECDYHIFIINIFIFIQENIKSFEGSTKYCDLLTIIINEQKEKILHFEKDNLICYLKIDKINKKTKTTNLEETKCIIDKFYKFVFSENFNNFNIINQIESNEFKDNLKLEIFRHLYKEYENIYELYLNDGILIYTPNQIKEVFLKKYDH
ncbi:conserved Plasmodium protein, unknown function [Plasmodium berghei]|uniref:Uncharacterized protein n=1 Tax=Plasmodium berghei TaxID=5821 RepID=A0A0Y9ZI12_PLABE|nr:conserved Plasmodium protein, unknown function [Plasmodium berghei]